MKSKTQAKASHFTVSKYATELDLRSMRKFVVLKNYLMWNIPFLNIVDNWDLMFVVDKKSSVFFPSEFTQPEIHI